MTKKLLKVGAVLVLAAVCLLALLRVPAVQRRVALAALSGTVENLEIGRLSAGLSGVRIDTVSGVYDGMRVAADSLALDYDAWAFIFGGKIEIPLVSVKNARVDIGAGAAKPAREEPATAAADATAGTLPQLDFYVGKVEISGRVRLPENKGEAAFDLAGGELGTRRSGTLSGTLSFNGVADGTPVRTDAALEVRTVFADAVLPASLSAQTTLSARMGALPPARLTLAAEAVGAGLQWTFSLSARQDARRPVSLSGTFDGTTGKLAADFALEVRDADIAPFLAGLPVPSADVSAKGSIAYAGGARTAASLDADLSARVWNLAKCDARLASLSALRAHAVARVGIDGNACAVNAFSASLGADGAPWVEVSVPSAFTFDRSDKTALSRLSGELARVRVNALPLEIFSAFAAPVQILSGALSGDVAVLADGGALDVKTTVPLRAERLDFVKDGARFTQPLAASLNFNARWHGDEAALGYGVALNAASGALLNAQGTVAYRIAARALDAKGSADVALAAVAAQPALAGALPANAVPPYALRLSYEGDFAANTVRVRALTATVAAPAQGAPLTFELLKPVSMPLGGAPDVAEGDVARLTLDALDLTLARACLPPAYAVTQGALSGSLVAAKHGAQFAVRTERPLALASLSLANGETVRRLCAQATFDGAYEPAAVRANVSDFKVWFASANVAALAGSLSVSANPSQWQALDAKLKCAVDLPSLFDTLPLLSAADNVRNGTATLNAEVSGGKFTGGLSAQKIQTAFGDQAGATVASLTANASGSYALSPLAIRLSAPLAMVKDDRQTRAALAVDWRAQSAAKDAPHVFDVALTGDDVHTADLLALASAFMPPAQNPEAQRTAAAPSAPVSTVPDARPIWGGFLGKASVKFSKITYENYVLTQPVAVAEISENALRLTTLSAGLADLKVGASGTLAFEKSRPKTPYALTASATIAGLELGKFLLNTRGNPMVEGSFAADAALTGDGANLGHLAARLQGHCNAESKNGVLHLLESSENSALRTVTGIGAIASALLGGKDDSVPVLTPLLDALGNLRYETCALSVVRGKNLDIELSRLFVKGNEAMVKGAGRVTYVAGVPLLDQPLSIKAVLYARGGLATSLAAFGLFAASADADGYHEGPAFPVGGTLNAIQTNFLRDILTQAVSRTLLNGGNTQKTTPTAAPAAARSATSSNAARPAAAPAPNANDAEAPVRSILNLIDALRK